MADECSAYVPGPNLCTNGFPQNAACMGHTCHGCGKPTDQPPACMREDLPALWFDAAGRPKFARQQNKGDA